MNKQLVKSVLRRFVLEYILVLLIVLFFVLIFFYYKSRVSLVTIQYAGGEIAFDIRWFSKQEIDDFQRQLRLAKDKSIEASDNAVVDKLKATVNDMYMAQGQNTTSSKADELVKYGELLRNGLITQEEFDVFKRSLMS